MKCCLQNTTLLYNKKKQTKPKQNTKGCSTAAGLQQTSWGKKKVATTFPKIRSL